jgi:hypothetical protein
MGEVIAKTAAVGDIVEDLRTTLSNATARGGSLLADAERFLAEVLQLVDEVGLQQASLEAAVEPLEAAVSAADSNADDLLAALYDETLTAAGRPGSDPFLTLLYPHGSSAYTEGPTSEQPERMRLLANLLERRIHPDIPETRLPDMIRSIRDAADQLQAAVVAAQGPAIQLEMLEKMYAVLARSGQIQLARLKKYWKALGMSEADIHELVPDRPRSRHKPRAKAEPDAAEGSED